MSNHHIQALEGFKRALGEARSLARRVSQEPDKFSLSLPIGDVAVHDKHRGPILFPPLVVNHVREALRALLPDALQAAIQDLERRVAEESAKAIPEIVDMLTEAQQLARGGKP